MTQVIVSMRDFLSRGEFGSIHLGISRDQLWGYLGGPEDWGPFPKAERLAPIWKYGDIEFHFNDDTLWLIFADHVETLHGGKAIDLDPWIFNGGAPVEQILEGLAMEQISCERIPWALDDGTERFRVGAGVELLFWDETQHLFCNGDTSPLARPGMTFNGFSYTRR